jgi:conjugal transfer pilus assembly protein TrbC
MLHILVPIVLVLTLTGSAFPETEKKPGDFDMKSIDETLNRSNELSKQMKVPENIHREEAEKAAQKASEIYRSEEFQEKVEKETERIRREVFKGLKDYYKDISGESKMHAKLSSNERIYLLISSSMPKQTLRNYMAHADRLRAPGMIVVMRGFIGGMKHVRPTLEFIHGILKRDPSCELPKTCDLYGVNFEIDPLLFRRYGIDKVPAVVYVPDIGVEDPEASEGLEENARVSSFHVFYGDVSLDYAIGRIHERTKSGSLDNLVRALKEGFYR